jgi:hypothetical protein
MEGNDEGGVRDAGRNRKEDGPPGSPGEDDGTPGGATDRLGEILPRALGLPEAERDPYLVQACGGDGELLADARALLWDSEHAEGYLEGLAARAGTLLDAALSASHPRIGSRIGAYRIERLLGAGGMGEVFLARRDDGQFEMRAAIKILRPGEASASLHQRFLEERRILASLEHPGITRLLDGGFTEDGRPCFIMEFAEGEAIDAHCERVDASLEDRLDLFLEVCDAVSHAHGKGIIHRDLKPGNIMVTREGRVKLLDFGIARSLGDGDPHAQRGDAVQRPLTLAWASPEQLGGKEVGLASDIYQLGLLLQALVGARDQHDPGESLDGVVRRALERDPALRHPDAAALAHDVRQFLRARAATSATSVPPARGSGRTWGREAPPDQPTGDAGDRIRRRRPARPPRTAAAAAGMLLLAAGAGLFLVPGRESPERLALLPTDAPVPWSPLVALLPFDVLGEGSEVLSDPQSVVVVADFLQGLGLVELVPMGRTVEIVGTDESLIPALAALGAEAVLTGTVTRVGARTTVRASILPVGGLSSAVVAGRGAVAGAGAIATFEREGPAEAYDRILDGIAVEVLQALLPEIPARAAEQDAGAGPLARDALRRFLRGEAEFRAARYNEARRHYEEASDLVPDFALAHYRNAVALEWAGLGARPEPAERAWELRDRLPEEERWLVEAYHLYLGYRDSEAEALYRDIVRRFPRSVEAWYQLGEVLYHRGPHRGRSILDAKEIYERVLGLDPRHLQALVHLARLAALEGDVAALDAYVSRYLAHVSAEESRGIELRLLGAALRSDVEEIGRLSRLLDQDTDVRRWLTAGRVAIYAGNAQAALDLLEPLFLPHQQVGLRGSAHLLAVHVEMMRGSLEGADAHVERLVPISTAGSAVARAWLTLHPAAAPPDPARLAAAHAHLLRWWDEADRHPGLHWGLHVGADREDRNRAVAADLLARVALALGNDEDALRWRRELAALETLEAERLGVILDARVLAASGDAEGALALLDDVGRPAGQSYSTSAPMMQPLVEGRLLRAQLLEALGREEEARTLWGSFAEDYVFGIGYMGLGREAVPPGR